MPDRRPCSTSDFQPGLLVEVGSGANVTWECSAPAARRAWTLTCCVGGSSTSKILTPAPARSAPSDKRTVRARVPARAQEDETGGSGCSSLRPPGPRWPCRRNACGWLMNVINVRRPRPGKGEERAPEAAPPRRVGHRVHQYPHDQGATAPAGAARWLLRRRPAGCRSGGGPGGPCRARTPCPRLPRGMLTKRTLQANTPANRPAGAAREDGAQQAEDEGSHGLLTLSAGNRACSAKRERAPPPTPAARIHQSMCSSSTTIGMAPLPMTAAWKALMSKRSPRASSAFRRRRRNLQVADAVGEGLAVDVGRVAQELRGDLDVGVDNPGAHVLPGAFEVPAEVVHAGVQHEAAGDETSP